MGARAWLLKVAHYPRATLTPEPLQYLQVTTLCCKSACVFIPRARRILAPEPLQYLQVTPPRCTIACAWIPRAALAPEPLQYLQVTTLCCTSACACIPRAALAPEPLHDLQVTTTSCSAPCRGIFACIPRAALAPEPPYDLQMAACAGLDKELRIQLEPILGFQPLQGLQLASARCEEEKDVRRNNKKEEEEAVKKKTHLQTKSIFLMETRTLLGQAFRNQLAAPAIEAGGHETLPKS